MRISDWSSDVCSSDLCRRRLAGEAGLVGLARLAEAGTQIDDTGQQPLAIRVDGLFEALLRQRGAEAADQTVADADVRGAIEAAGRVEHARAAGQQIGRAEWRERGGQYV